MENTYSCALEPFTFSVETSSIHPEESSPTCDHTPLPVPSVTCTSKVAFPSSDPALQYTELNDNTYCPGNKCRDTHRNSQNKSHIHRNHGHSNRTPHRNHLLQGSISAGHRLYWRPPILSHPSCRPYGLFTRFQPVGMPSPTTACSYLQTGESNVSMASSSPTSTTPIV